MSQHKGAKGGIHQATAKARNPIQYRRSDAIQWIERKATARKA